MSRPMSDTCKKQIEQTSQTKLWPQDCEVTETNVADLPPTEMGSMVASLAISTILKKTGYPYVDLEVGYRQELYLATFVAIKLFFTGLYYIIEKMAEKKDDTNKNIKIEAPAQNAMMQQMAQQFGMAQQLGLAGPTSPEPQFVSLREYDTVQARQLWTSQLTGMILPLIMYYFGKNAAQIGVSVVMTVFSFFTSNMVQEYFFGIKKPRPFEPDFLTKKMKEFSESALKMQEEVLRQQQEQAQPPPSAPQSSSRAPKRSRTVAHQD
ncbi:hypothetical protein BLNAU_15589 [Blattamonas nauphoetae]|uniref:Uncharacterized protein n=1 Tax=Blattamonas nauphoetae TaxID=2049346 RepID=A0ABQ9XC46_9EUKA|nr:hypothetical protein BLNAU_15589 [Blattamonas nauphoetae]